VLVADFPEKFQTGDFIVCGSGSSGSVVAGRLAENPEVDMLWQMTFPEVGAIVAGQLGMKRATG
jgi:hypothetical protein